MEEAQHLADRVVVIARGTGHRRGHARHARRATASPSSASGPATASEPPLPAGAEAERGHVRFRTETPTRDLAPLLAWAADRGIELEGLTVTRPTLEDVYLELTEEPAA